MPVEVPRGVARWDADGQRWEGEEATTFAPPPPPLPQHLPQVPPSSVPETPPAAGTAVGGSGWGFAVRRKPVVALAATAVLVGGGTAVWLAGDEDARPPKAGPGPSPAPTASSGGPTDSGTGGSSRGALPPDPEETPVAPPEGFAIAEDEAGFTLAVPEGWERTSNESGVFYRSADERSLLQVFTVSEPGLTPLEAVGSASEALARTTEAYREYSIGPVTGGRENPLGDAAELHYAYENEAAGGTRECIERVFTATDGDTYAVLACVPGDETPYQRTVLETALAHFTPGPAL